MMQKLDRRDCVPRIPRCIPVSSEAGIYCTQRTTVGRYTVAGKSLY